MMKFKEILEYNFLNIGDFHLNLFSIILAIVIITLARVLLSVLGRIIERYFKKKDVDPGRQFAFLQFVKYIVYTAAVLMALEAIGISISVVWGGAAALMVGIGLGLQQTFNDLVSGLILLIEGAIEVGDIVEIDGVVGTVTTIDIRTSKIESRDKISILVPNSKLVGDKAINWSHSRTPNRFQVDVGVSYGSDVDLVTKLLLEAAMDHVDVLKTPKPVIQFKDFGNSSLDFVLHFYNSKDYLRIEMVKSEIRYKIIQLFRANDIEIPFPQTDLWVRNPQDLMAAK